MRRVLLMTVVGAVALIGTMLPASAADDGYFFRLNSGTVLCSPATIGLGNPSSVDVNYPAGATMSLQVDAGSGFTAPQDITAFLNPAGATGTASFFGAATAADPPGTLRVRWTLSVNGTPTFQQTVDAVCANDVVTDPEPGTLELVSEDLFATADPVAGTDPAAAIVAQPTTTG